MRCIGFIFIIQCSVIYFSHTTIHFDSQFLKNYIVPVPDQKAQQWIDTHHSLLAYLARMPYPLSSWQEKYVNGNWHLYKLGIKNVSYTNYIFQIPHTDYWVQISGPNNRMRSLYIFNTHSNPNSYTEIAKHWEFRNSSLLDALEIVPTYQTVSRFAYYLILADALEDHACTHIYLAPTYLIPLCTSLDSIDDEQCIVVQKHIAPITRLISIPEKIKTVSPAAIEELFNVICATGYWNVAHGLYIDTHNNLVLLDYEQRKSENPKDFFYQNLQSFEECVYNGIYELLIIHLKPHAPALYTYARWLIATNDSLASSSLWHKYAALLNN